MITHRQAELLRFIERYQVAYDGVSPSMREMATGVGACSAKRVSEILNALEERGFIRRVRGKARAIEVLPREVTPRTRHAYFVWHDELQCLIPLSAKKQKPLRDQRRGSVVRQSFRELQPGSTTGEAQ